MTVSSHVPNALCVPRPSLENNYVSVTPSLTCLIDKDTLAWKSQTHYLKSHWWWKAEPGFQPGLTTKPKFYLVYNAMQNTWMETNEQQMDVKKKIRKTEWGIFPL